jgi:diguanylate cyclase (GGDEF)-like protein
MSVTDELTGLKNRRYLFDRLPKELKLSQRHTKPLSCIMFDLDHFKCLNDTYGHAMGDQVLRTVATVAKSECRESDVIIRYGGEEFVVILPLSCIDAAIKTAERLKKAIGSHRISFEGNDTGVTASFGVAWFNPLTPGEGEDLTALLLKRADEALYHAKGNGRNRVESV